MTRALLPAGAEAVARGQEVLRRIQLVRISDRVLQDAGQMQTNELRSLATIHLASTRLLGKALKMIVTYDEGMAAAAQASGWSVATPR